LVEGADHLPHVFAWALAWLRLVGAAVIGCGALRGVVMWHDMTVPESGLPFAAWASATCYLLLSTPCSPKS
jgi:hypothetical protein